MELDYRAIGIRIRRLRKTLGFTQQTLAELSNHLSYRAWSDKAQFADSG